jgi:sentrin-specific protease 1
MKRTRNLTLSHLEVQTVKKLFADANENVGRNNSRVVAKGNASVSSASVTRGCFGKLQPGIYLNDTIISNYCGLVMIECLKHMSGTKILETHFYSRLMSESLNADGTYQNMYQYKNVERWYYNTTRSSGSKINIFEQYKLLLVPVNIPSIPHWLVVSINFDTKKITAYDSLQSYSSSKSTSIEIMKNMMRWLNDEHKARYNGLEMDQSGWQINASVTCPQQQNGVDCGVFTCLFIDLLAFNVPINSFHQSDVANYRLKIGCDILRGKLMYTFEDSAV